MLIPKMKHYYSKYISYKFAVYAIFQSCKYNGFLVLSLLFSNTWCFVVLR